MRHGTVIKEPFALADHTGTVKMHLPKEVGSGIHAAFFELERLGFFEQANRNLAGKPMYRIPPHLVEAVAKFVKSKK